MNASDMKREDLEQHGSQQLPHQAYRLIPCAWEYFDQTHRIPRDAFMSNLSEAMRDMMFEN